MSKLIVLVVVLAAVIAVAQTCIVPAPASPPTPNTVVVHLPVDGGTQGCTIEAVVEGGETRHLYSISNGKCATTVAIAKQAAAIDNGWDDGGVP